MFIISAQPNFSKRKTCGSPVSQFIPQVFFNNLSNVFLCALDVVIIHSVNANLNIVPRLCIFVAQADYRLNVARGNETTNSYLRQ